MAVNLSPVGGAAAQFFDNSGNVLTGGKLYTYAAGTTTPAVTYTTSSGITLQPNPIVLNAAGRVPDSGEIWLTDSVLYKFVLKDANNVLIATWDNIDGINSNFVAYSTQNETQTATQGQTAFTLATIQYTPATNSLAVYVNGSKQILTLNYIETSSTVVTFVDGLNVGDVVQFTTAVAVSTNVVDASNVSYNEGQSGAVNRNVEAKLQEQVSVLDFGADPTGATDSTVAFTAALAASQNIYVPEGTYVVDTITLPYSYGSGIVLRGANKENTILEARDINSPIFNSGGTFAANHLISQFTLKAHSLGSTGPAVDMKNISFSMFEEIIVLGNGTGKWANGFHFYAFDGTPYGHCYKNVINGVYVSTSCITNALFLLENNPNVNIISNVFVGSHISGPVTSIPYVVQYTSPNGGNLYNLILEKFLVECTVTQFAFDFGDDSNCIVLKDSYSEITGTTFNIANTSNVAIENFNVNGASFPTQLPLNFTIFNMNVGGINEGTGANQLGPAQNILFTSTPIASANPRALDDYQEGTWTPVAKGTATAGTTTHVLPPRGYFVKVGKLVYVEFQFIGTLLSGASGNFEITGLPFAADNGTLFYSSPSWTFGQLNLLSSANTGTLTGWTGPGATNINIQLSDLNTSNYIAVGSIKNYFYFSGSACYVASY